MLAKRLLSGVEGVLRRFPHGDGVGSITGPVTYFLSAWRSLDKYDDPLHRGTNLDAMVDYSGHVTPSGPAARHRINGMSIIKASVGPMDNNVYLLICDRTREAVLVDAANDADRIRALVAEEKVALRGIVTTHRHADHWQALAAVAEATDATIYAGAEDAAELPVVVDVALRDGDEIRFGAIRLGVIGLRGHTPGSVAIRYDEPSGRCHLITGDSLFPGGPGRTWSAEDFTSLMSDLESRVFGPLADETWVYPGHGDDTTLGAERPHLQEWWDRGW